MDLRSKSIKRASWVGIIANFFLAIMKIVTGALSGSMAVLADGIDSSGDVMTSMITLYIANLIVKPPDVKFPYGYGKAETNATNVLAFILFFAGAQLAITSIHRLVSGEVNQVPEKIAIYVMIISIAGKLFLAWYQTYIGKKTKSTMLKASGKNMQGDVLISISVLAGLICTHIFKLPVLDVIVAMFVSIWIIWIAIKIFLETNLQLMDGNVDPSIYADVIRIAESVPGVYNPHRVRCRNIGPKKMINIDIELNGKVSLDKAHEISHVVERKIKENIEDVFDVAIHIEPHGDKIEEKQFGISKELLNGK